MAWICSCEPGQVRAPRAQDPSGPGQGYQGTTGHVGWTSPPSDHQKPGISKELQCEGVMPP